MRFLLGAFRPIFRERQAVSFREGKLVEVTFCLSLFCGVFVGFPGIVSLLHNFVWHVTILQMSSKQDFFVEEFVVGILVSSEVIFLENHKGEEGTFGYLRESCLFFFLLLLLFFFLLLLLLLRLPLPLLLLVVVVL